MFLHADSEDSDQADAQADPSLRWAHRPFSWFSRAAAQIFFTTKLRIRTCFRPSIVSAKCCFDKVSFGKVSCSGNIILDAYVPNVPPYIVSFYTSFQDVSLLSRLSVSPKPISPLSLL